MLNLKFNDRFDAAIFFIVIIILLALFSLLVSNLIIQYFNYNEAIGFALSDQKSIDYSSVLILSAAWDYAVVKKSALFMSFLLVFSGALYVLRAGKTNFKLRAENADFKGSLSLSSPGLIMVILGTLLAAHTLSTKSRFEYNSEELQSSHNVRLGQNFSELETDDRGEK